MFVSGKTPICRTEGAVDLHLGGAAGARSGVIEGNDAAEVPAESRPVDPIADDVEPARRGTGSRARRQGCNPDVGLRKKVEDPRVGDVARRARGRIHVARRAEREVRGPRDAGSARSPGAVRLAGDGRALRPLRVGRRDPPERVRPVAERAERPDEVLGQPRPHDHGPTGAAVGALLGAERPEIVDHRLERVVRRVVVGGPFIDGS